MGASLEAQMPTNMPAMQETRVQSIGQEYALEEGMATHSSILAWRIPIDRGSLASYSPEGRRVGHNWSDLACRHAHTVRTRTHCLCMHTGICVLDLSIHLLSWGLTYQDCCVTWAAREVAPMGLANFASLQTILTLFVCWRGRSLCCILPWQKLRALSCFLGWPIYTPSERGVCLFFFFFSFKHDLCFCFCPRNPPLSTFSFIRVCPGSLPLTPANLIHMALGSSLLDRKHSPKWSRRRQDRGGHGFGGAQAPPPSSSFLPALQMGFREGTSDCFPGVNA